MSFFERIYEVNLEGALGGKAALLRRTTVLVVVNSGAFGLSKKRSSRTSRAQAFAGRREKQPTLISRRRCEKYWVNFMFLAHLSLYLR